MTATEKLAKLLAQEKRGKEDQRRHASDPQTDRKCSQDSPQCSSSLLFFMKEKISRPLLPHVASRDRDDGTIARVDGIQKKNPRA
jgi:hypothetical protein